MNIRESDWKLFKQRRSVALERFSQQVLDQAQAICSKPETTAHERYLQLYGLIQQQDRELAKAFDNFSRSSAPMSLRLIRSLELLTDEELSGFSKEIRDLTDPR